MPRYCNHSKHTFFKVNTMPHYKIKGKYKVLHNKIECILKCKHLSTAT